MTVSSSRWIFTAVLLVLSTLVTPAPQARAASSYTLTEVPAVAFEAYANARAVNDKGVVAADAYNGIGPTVATSVRKGEVTALSAAPDYGSAADISPKGRVVGSAGIPYEQVRATVWYQGETTELPSLGGDAAEARAISGENTIVGRSTLEPGDFELWHAVLWERGEPTDLGTLPDGGSSIATDVNDSGQVVGAAAISPDGFAPEFAVGYRSGTHAVLWEDGEITDLGTLPGGDASFAAGINERGQIVGSSNLEPDGFVTHAVMWEDGEIIDLGVLPGGESSYAHAINVDGLIVGQATNPPDAVNAGLDAYTAVLWEDGEIVALTGLDDRDDDVSAGGVALLSALGLNDKGQIVGQAIGVHEGGSGYFGYLLTPT